MSNELEQSVSPNIKKNTLAGYKTRYRLLLELLNDIEVKKSNPLKIIEVIDNYKATANSKATLLNIAIVIYNHFNIDKSLLLKFRNRLQDVKKQEQIIKNKKLKEDSLPSVAELKRKLKHYYENKDWNEYIILYLLLNYQVRNTDLYLTISRDGRDDNINNLILIRKNYANYIRNNYKTHSKYGKKVHKIKSPKFMRALMEFLGDEKIKHLLCLLEIQERN